MKKLLPILLVLSMLIASCLLLSSCSGMTEAKASKDPLSAIGTAFETSLSSFFAGDKAIAEIDKKAAEMGSYNLILATDTFPNGKAYAIDETLYIDKKGNSLVSETKLTLAGTNYRATIWGDKESVAVKSEAIFGSKDTFKLTFSRLISELEDSDLVAALELDEASVNEIISTIETLTKSMDEKNPLIPKKDANKLKKEFFEILAQEIKTEKLTVDGKEADHVVITYVLNNDNLVQLLEFYMDMVKDYELVTGDDFDALQESIDNFISDMDESGELDMSCAFYINGKSGALSQMDIKVIFEPAEDPDLPAGEESEPFEADVSLTISESKIALEGEVAAGEEKFDLTVEIDKSTKGDKTAYTFFAGLRRGNVRIDILDATYEYDKKTGDITLEGTIATDEENSIDIELKGTCKIEESSYTYSLDSFKISADKEELAEFKSDRNNEISLTVSAIEKLPEIDEDATDIMDMDKDDWTKFMEDFQNSDLIKDLGDILGGGGTIEPDFDIAA